MGTFYPARRASSAKRWTGCWRPGVPERERAEFATLIYYPAHKLAQLKPRQKDLDAWYRQTLLRLMDVCRFTSSKYTRSFVRKRMPKGFRYIIDELLHAHFEDHDKDGYYGASFRHRRYGPRRRLHRGPVQLIRRLSVYRLHIVGDIFDRGPRPDIILDELAAHYAVDVQWGNHDVEWMGAAAGSEVCIASVIHVALSYNNLESLEDGYGLNLRPLALFAEEHYREADVSGFWPKLVGSAGEYSAQDLARVARMHKAIAVILAKLECQVLARNPQFGMADRALLERVDFASQTLTVDGSSTACATATSPRWTRGPPRASPRQSRT